MDITWIDVTAVADVKVGDAVILLGSSDHFGVSAWISLNKPESNPWNCGCDPLRRGLTT